MARGRLSSVLDFLHRLERPEHAQPSDCELLQRFTNERDEEAFHLLIQRHGPMVLATCRRILQNLHEAEDCFQATFIVLARKARSIRNQQSLGSWLYRVAYHIAVTARARLLKQRTQDQKVAKMLSAESDDNPCSELVRILDEELQHLPEKYRMPLVLCYLEGKTHQQVAEELAWPTGTMSRRIARAQELLRQRLLRRGIALSAVVFTQAMTAFASDTNVPAALASATTKAAVVSLAGGTAVATTKSCSLAEEAIRGMAMAKLRTAALVAVLTVSAVSVNAAIFWPRTEAPAPPATTATMTEPRNEPAFPEQPSDWGEPVHGVRLRCSCDRADYRSGRDLVRVAFALHNVSTSTQSLLFLTDQREFTDVRITGPDGTEYFVPGTKSPLPEKDKRGGFLQPHGIERVSMMVDPEKIAGGLRPGRYRLRGMFRRMPAQGSDLTPAELRLESNETSFTILPPDAKDEALPSGAEVRGCALSLIATPTPTTWRTGDPPLSFTVVLNRRADDLAPLRFLEANRLGMFYSLHITDSNGHVLRALQPPESAGADPQVEPLAHARLMFLQLERIPVGKSVGERIAWDPSGPAKQPYRLEPMVRTQPLEPGRYTVRVVYQLRDRDLPRFGDHPDAIRLESNAVNVDIGR